MKNLKYKFEVEENEEENILDMDINFEQTKYKSIITILKKIKKSKNKKLID
jgi:hypothetical protein